MDYNKLLQSLEDFGETAQGLVKRRLRVEIGAIQENVIMSPSWEPTDMPCFEAAELISPLEASDVKVWDIRSRKLALTYIKTGITSPHFLERLLSLGVTNCKRIIFIGSAGSLDAHIHIGDILIPGYSVCGDGASRYIASDNLRHDVFGEKTYPDARLAERLIHETTRICSERNASWHMGKTFSTDSVLTEFLHKDTVLDLRCNSIEMETAVAFRAAKFMGIPLAALLVVSDNIITRKSLFHGRTAEDMACFKLVKNEMMPRIVLAALR